MKFERGLSPKKAMGIGRKAVVIGENSYPLEEFSIDVNQIDIASMDSSQKEYLERREWSVVFDGYVEDPQVVDVEIHHGGDKYEGQAVVNGNVLNGIGELHKS